MQATTQRALRRYHLYIGMFFAPMLLLFAVSGAVQVFRLNEADGWGSVPPGVLVWMGAVHKNQALPRAEAAPAGRPVNDARAKGASGHAAEKMSGAKRSRGHRSFPLEILTGLLGIGLAVSTLLGVLIALNTRAMRRTGLILLMLGTLLPLGFLYLT